MTQLYPAFIPAWLVSVALLALFHLLWKNTHRIVRYMLGMGAVCMGCTVAGSILNDPVLAFGPWFMASAGLPIALWLWIEERTEVGKKNAQKNGEIIGAAHRLSQDLIDAGGLERGNDQASRRN